MSIDNYKLILAVKIEKKFLFLAMSTNNRHFDYEGYLVRQWFIPIMDNGNHLLTKKEVEEILAIFKVGDKEYLKNYTQRENFKVKGKFVSFKSYSNFFLKDGIEKAITLEQIEKLYPQMADSIRDIIKDKNNISNFHFTEDKIKNLKRTYFPVVIKKEPKEPKNWVIKFERGFFTSRTSRQLYSSSFIQEAKRFTLKNAKISLKKIKRKYPKYSWELLEITETL